ncbi:site-specific recombinase XerD [Palleronia aestuarii]|uniref:Site-specific recombinase XerD n=1 Tax=Palleronia aestuarii TaxID=568105 RepID=A0A2W7NE06_9RHOB|nr:tyrosine-type recombinase/integrase [Palleronia aestuarii]PZX18408.1 site-specific recombinase XerD [Palleronia aestuarii]
MKLKGLKRYESGGIKYVYHRATGSQLPAHLPEDHPDFLAAYLAACNQGAAKPPKVVELVKPNSVADIVAQYLRSHSFKGLSESYRDVRRRDMMRLLAVNDGAVGRVAFASVRPEHIRHQMDSMERNPANERLKSWSALGEFALGRRLIITKPTEGVKKLKVEATQGYLPWTFSDISKYRSRWEYGTEERIAFELQYWAGSRISDTVGLGPKNVDDDGWLVFIQEKTNSEVSVPFDRGLPKFAVAEDLEHLRLAIAAMGERTETFMLTVHGKPRSRKGASQWFSERAQMANVPAGKTSHGLRKSRMILHAERGANIHQIAAWSGHETLKEIERYTKRAERRRLLSPEPSALETGKFLKE